MSLFGSAGGQYEEVNDKTVEEAVKKYKLLELFALAQKLGKTDFRENLEGKEVSVKIEPERVIFETPEVVMEYTPQKFLLKNKQTGEVVEKEPTLQEFYTMYKEIRKLLGAGSVQNYLQLKAREPEFKQQFLNNRMPFGSQQGFNQAGGGFSWGSALLGLGGGMLLGYLLGSAIGESFAHTVETAPPMSHEEQERIEQQATAPVEEVVNEPTDSGALGDAGFGGGADFDGVEGDYLADLPDDPFGGSDDIAMGDDFGGFDDFGDFDV
jgi:hypothetical protein